MVTCGNCGSNAPDGAETCPHCGMGLSGEFSGDSAESGQDAESGEGNPPTGSDREISSDEAKSGTTRVYGLSESEGCDGSPEGPGEGGRPPDQSREHGRTPSEPREDGRTQSEPREDGRPSEPAEAVGTATVEPSSTRGSQTQEPNTVGPEASDPPQGSRPRRESTDESDIQSRRRILGGLGLLALGAGGWYAMFGRDGDGGAGGGIPSIEEMELELGILLPESGGLRKMGPRYREGIELVVQQVNEDSPDVQVATGFEDTASDAREGVGGAGSLVDAGYPMLCGAVASGISVAIAEEVAIPSEVPMLSPLSRDPAFTAFDADYTFRIAISTALQGRAMAAVARERRGVESVATLFPNRSNREPVATAFVESFQAAGGTITDRVTYSDGRDSYVESLSTTLAGDPEALVVDSNPQTGAKIFEDFYTEFDRGDMPVVVSDTLSDSSIPMVVGQDMSNVTGAFPDPDEPGEDFVEDKYESYYDNGRSPSFAAQSGYDAAATLLLAHAAAGESDGEAIRDQIRAVTDPGGTEITGENIVEGVHRAAAGEQVEYRGATGEIRFDDSGNQTGVPFEYFRFTSDGDRESIDEFELE